MNIIDGVQLDQLTRHPDERGYFCEVARVSRLAVPFAQWSHSFMYSGVVKYGHYHERQWDLWYVIGRLKVTLYDLRDWSKTYRVRRRLLLGDEPALLHIPPGVAHGCRALTGTHLVYFTSNEYDGSDEGRLPSEHPGSDYEWLSSESETL